MSQYHSITELEKKVSFFTVNTAEQPVSILCIIFIINPLVFWRLKGFFFYCLYVAISWDSSLTSPCGGVLCISSWEENSKADLEDYISHLSLSKNKIF